MSTRERDYAAERDRAKARATGATATEDAPAPFKKRSLTGTLAAAHSAVASSDPIKVTGDIECVRDDGTPGTPGAAPSVGYMGRLRIPRAKSRGLIVGYEYRLVAPGDDVTAPLEAVVKFVGTPDATSEDVVSVDFIGRAARELAEASA